MAVPTRHQAYDLLVTLPEGTKRVQVKTGTRRNGHGTWTVGVGRRRYSLDKSTGKVPYDSDELDYFFVIDGDGLMFLIPRHVVGERVTINVGKYAVFQVGDASSLVDWSRATTSQLMN